MYCILILVDCHFVFFCACSLTCCCKIANIIIYLYISFENYSPFYILQPITYYNVNVNLVLVCNSIIVIVDCTLVALLFSHVQHT